MWIGLVLFLCCSTISVAFEIVAAYNCGSHTEITSKYITYQRDKMYDKEHSIMAGKKALPPSIIDQTDRELLASERVSQHPSFSYHFKLQKNDHYVLIFKFIEVSQKRKGQRVFSIKLGDEIIHKVDIFEEAGYAKILHKWIEFDLEDDIVYINDSYPLLNAYSFKTKLLKVNFEKVKGLSKIDAIALVKGSDSSKFLKEYLAYQQSKKIVAKQHVSQKYHYIPRKQYPPMDGSEQFDTQAQDIYYYLKQIKSLRFIGTIFAVLFLIYHEELYQRIKITYSNFQAAKVKQQ